MHHACTKHFSSVAEILVLAGANVNATDVDGHTALHCACEKNHSSVAKVLLCAGAKVNAKGGLSGWTALHLASQNNHSSVAKVLIQAEADINAVGTKAGWTPLHLACKKNQSLLAKLLVSKGADINAKDADGCTALHLACESNDSLAVGVLISAGADLNAKESLFGRTALHCACKENNTRIAETLISAGADVDAKDVGGQRPFELTYGSLRTTVQFAKLYCIGSIPLECVKICFIGPEEAGKTTLHKAIRRGRLYSWVSSDETVGETSCQEDRTVGMEVSEAYISSAGHVVLCDFAGQYHFHRTHSIFFHPSNTIYILVLNGKHSEEQMLKEGRYWLSFLSASSPAGSRPVVVIVISRADICPPEHLKSLIDRVPATLRMLFDSQIHVQESCFLLDCRKSQSRQMKEFRTFVAEIKQDLLKVICF
jgi:ankyrin repeat protein